jgi:hypothetical protein
MRCIETIEGDRNRSGTGRRCSPSTIPGGRESTGGLPASPRAGRERASGWRRRLVIGRDRLEWVSFSDGVFAKVPDSGSSLWIRTLVTSCVASELGNRAHCPVPGEALRAVSTCGVIANGVRHGEPWTVDKIITGRCARLPAQNEATGSAVIEASPQ